MRLLLFLSTNDIGGCEKQAYLLAKGLKAHGYEIDCLVLTGRGPVSSLFEEMGVSVCCVEHGRRMVFRSIFRIFRHFIRHHYDWIYVFGFGANLFARFLAPMTSNKSLITAQRSVDDNRNRLVSFLDRITSFRVRYYISNSISAAELLKNREKIPEKKIVYIPNGISPALEQQSSDEPILNEFSQKDDSFVYINVANLRLEKGQCDLIEAMRILKDKGTCPLLYLVGEGSMREELEWMIREYDLEQHVHLLGTIRNVADLLIRADAFVFSSLWEGMPNAIMEAMLCKLPVITTDVGDTSVLVQDTVNGYVVLPRNPEMLAEKMELLMQNAQKVRLFGEKSFEIIQEYSIENMVQRHRDIFEGNQKTKG